VISLYVLSGLRLNVTVVHHSDLCYKISCQSRHNEHFIEARDIAHTGRFRTQFEHRGDVSYGQMSHISRHAKFIPLKELKEHINHARMV
jgi:hypothetical protein